MDGADKLIADIAAKVGPTQSMSEPLSISEPTSEPQAESQSRATGPTDRSGRHFDASIHSVLPSGEPRITAQGYLRVKRGAGGRVSGPSTAGNSHYHPPEVDENVRACGIAVSRSIVMCCQMMGGDDWAPSPIELGSMDTAWASYFEARGISEIPPELMLATVMLAYAGPRLQRSATLRGRMSSMWNKLRGRNVGTNGAQPDNRNNGQRQD